MGGCKARLGLWIGFLMGLAFVVSGNPGPVLAAEQAGCGKARADGAAPEQKQRLHILIVAPGAPDREALKKEMLRHLGVDPKDMPRGFSADFEYLGFEKATLQNVLAGDVTADDVRRELQAIGDRIRQARRGDGTNDVVLFYYEGSIARHDGRIFLHTTRSLQKPDDPDTLNTKAIALDKLPDMPGTRLLLVNAVEPAEAPSSRPK
jgi:hypothetical protein